MKYIITESQNIRLRRRIQQIDKLIDLVLESMYPCDYSDEHAFYIAFIFEFTTTCYDVDLGLGDFSEEELLSYIREHKRFDIERYYINAQEDC